MKVACFSLAVMDFFPQQNKHFAGGNSLNQTIRYHQMGYPGVFIGALGTDDNGDRIATLLQNRSIDTSHVHRINGHTANNRLVNDEAGERYSVEGSWDGGVYNGFELRESDWEYLSSFDVWSTHANCPSYLEALQRNNSSQFMSVDFLHLKDYDLLEKSLRVVNIAYFGGTMDMVNDLAQIAKDNRGVLVLTLGAEGSIAFEGNKSYSQEALPINKVVDTTGCGDAFQSAFTTTYFHTKDIQASLLAGAELGKIAASSFGGIPWE